MTVSVKTQQLIGSICRQFHNRTFVEGKKHGLDYGVVLTTEIENSVLWLKFHKNNETSSITMPIPYVENGVELIKYHDTVRAICPFWMEAEQVRLDYLDIMLRLALFDSTGLLPKSMVKTTPFLQQIANGFIAGTQAIAVYKYQKAINEIINKMPLHETDMNSFVMNKRLIIVDPIFDGISVPADKLKYQVEKSKKYFTRGWTPIGLSDGVLADSNYILEVDLRKLSPFGIRYHNPQRNLYSTLGMKGAELPRIISNSAKELEEQGICRKGWNLFTAFVDVPEVFEDQILVDISHADKFTSYDKRIQTFFRPMVKVGQKIKQGDRLAISENEEYDYFDIVSDHAEVIEVSPVNVNVGGQLSLAHNIIVRYYRNFCYGTKITNLHGNKGIIKMMELGFATDPMTGKTRKIDVIVGAKTVGKRKNYGQIMEALTSCIIEREAEMHGKEVERLTIADDWSQPYEEVVAGLVKRGYNADGTWKCKIHTGDIKAVCGTVFWGCIKTPHDQLWEENETSKRNNKDMRRAGLKFSHVEFRSLETLFGENNAVIDEIMQYAQGSDNVSELLTVLKSKKGIYPEKLVKDYTGVKAVDQASGMMINGGMIAGSVVDEFFMPEGFLFQLPFPIKTVVVKGEEFEVPMNGAAEAHSEGEEYICDKVYIPCGTLRKCWKHGSGRYGLSEIGIMVNNIISATQMIMANPADTNSLRFYYSSVSNYFAKVCKTLGTKRGDLATYMMAVRYPVSAKAVAALDVTLPKNVVEIHRDMAAELRLVNNDVVLVERFPCLGFMSIRPQKVRITDNPLKKYVISASGNSLVSTNLDFDGDVIYIAGFHTKEARELLNKEWTNPNQTCYAEISALNARKGAPHIKEYILDDFKVSPFSDLTIEENAVIVEKNTGVKAQTGPVIALTYNIMRIVENSELAKDHKMKVAVEMFLEKAAQSVFEQKHGGKSLYEIVIDGVCTADVEQLVAVGFKRSTTEKLCLLIADRAKALKVFDLVKYHTEATEKGWANIISKIVRSQNKIYSASRSILSPVVLLNALEAPAVDIPSRMFKWSMANKIAKITTAFDGLKTSEMLEAFKLAKVREAAKELLNVVDVIFTHTEEAKEMPKKRRLSFADIKRSRGCQKEGI